MRCKDGFVADRLSKCVEPGSSIEDDSAKSHRVLPTTKSPRVCLPLYIVMAYMVMAYIVMAYTVMAYIVASIRFGRLDDSRPVVPRHTPNRCLHRCLYARLHTPALIGQSSL